MIITSVNQIHDSEHCYIDIVSREGKKIGNFIRKKRQVLARTCEYRERCIYLGNIKIGIHFFFLAHRTINRDYRRMYTYSRDDVVRIFAHNLYMHGMIITQYFLDTMILLFFFLILSIGLL
jgi:hypothetical protein